MSEGWWREMWREKEKAMYADLEEQGSVLTLEEFSALLVRWGVDRWWYDAQCYSWDRNPDRMGQ